MSVGVHSRSLLGSATLLLVSLPGLAWADTYVVTTTGDTLSSTDGVCSLREAVEGLSGTAVDSTCRRGAATSSAVIRLANGVYCLGSALEVPASVRILGNGATVAILDGGNGSSGLCGTASGDRLFTLEDGITVELSGLALQGGESALGGGAVHVGEGVALSLNDVSIQDNQVRPTSGGYGGGGVFLGAGSTLDADGLQLLDNVVNCTTASVSECPQGGGMATHEGVTVTLVDSLVAGNSVVTNAGTARGGGIHLGSDETSRSNLTLSGTTLSGNAVTGMGTSGANGGGLAADTCGTVTLEDTVIDSNTADAEAVRAFGAGLAITFCDALDMSTSTVSNNVTTVTGANIGAYGGGMYVGSVLDTSVVRSTITGNESVHDAVRGVGPAYGGGIYLHGETAVLLNTTISGNTVDADGDGWGGGLFAKGLLDAYVEHSTIASNTVSGGTAAYGGGVSHFPGTAADRNERVMLLNTIVAGNTATSSTLAKGPDVYSKIYTLYNNILSSATDTILDNSLATSLGTDQLNVDPQLGSLGNNGGPVSTHALGSSSPARAGATCLDVDGGAITTDARGVSRDARCDIGAYEYPDRRTPPRTAVSADLPEGGGEVLGGEARGLELTGDVSGAGCSTVSHPGALLAGLGLLGALRRRPAR